jgi:hypothetical protein
VINMRTYICKDNRKIHEQCNTSIVNDLILGKLNDMEGKEHYQVNIYKKCIIMLQ